MVFTHHHSGPALEASVTLPGLYLRTGEALAEREAIHRVSAIEEVPEEAQGKDQRPTSPRKSDTLARASGSAQLTSVGLGRILQLWPDQSGLRCHPLARGGTGSTIPLPSAPLPPPTLPLSAAFEDVISMLLML
jgi:hypothetical protein